MQLNANVFTSAIAKDSPQRQEPIITQSLKRHNHFDITSSPNNMSKFGRPENKSLSSNHMHGALRSSPNPDQILQMLQGESVGPTMHIYPDGGTGGKEMTGRRNTDRNNSAVMEMQVKTFDPINQVRSLPETMMIETNPHSNIKKETFAHQYSPNAAGHMLSPNNKKPVYSRFVPQSKRTSINTTNVSLAKPLDGMEHISFNPNYKAGAMGAGPKQMSMEQQINNMTAGRPVNPISQLSNYQ